MVKRFRKSVQYSWRYSTKMRQFFGSVVPLRSQMSKVNSGVTGPNFTKFSHNIEASFTRQFTKAQMRNFFSHYESANKLPRKRNIDRYTELQQRFAKPHTGLYTTFDQPSIP